MIELTDESFKEAKKFLEQYQADLPLQPNQRFSLHNLLEIFKIVQTRAEQLTEIEENKVYGPLEKDTDYIIEAKTDNDEFVTPGN